MPQELFAETVAPSGEALTCRLIAFHLGDNESPFFCWSPYAKNGPGIARSGTAPPSMRTVWNLNRPWDSTADPEEMRNWCDYIEDDGVEVEEFLSTGATLCGGIPPSAQRRRLYRWRVLLAQRNPQRVHTRAFGERYPGLNVVGQVGCGDTTMNHWHVAYVRPHRGDEAFLHLEDEPLRDREYACLVKWTGGSRAGSITFEQNVRFMPGPTPAVYVDGSEQRRDIEFAVSGKPLLGSLGNLIPLNQVTHYFRDLRHLFSLPKLTPRAELGAPVVMFGEPVPINLDLWLGEKQLLDDTNLQRAACQGPVLLDRLYGGLSVTREYLNNVLLAERYTPTSDFVRWQPGSYRIHDNGTGFEIYFRRAIYPWNILAVGRYEEGERKGQQVVLSFVCGGLSGRTHFTLEGAIEKLVSLTSALGIRLQGAMLLDEGGDVFQRVDLGRGLQASPLDPIPPGGRLACQRRLVRCCFFFAVSEKQ